jgi:magnesium-transporting ATPase (P-type)
VTLFALPRPQRILLQQSENDSEICFERILSIDAQEKAMNWYQLDITDIFAELGTSEQGLSQYEIEERIKLYGLNKLAEEEKISKLRILLRHKTKKYGIGIIIEPF